MIDVLFESDCGRYSTTVSFPATMMGFWSEIEDFARQLARKWQAMVLPSIMDGLFPRPASFSVRP